MYSVGDYVWMIADDARVAAYAGALRAVIQPGARVLEVGAGFGFFSVLAARAGAARVDAVETNPVVHLGPKVATANGCADRITFHHRDVRQLTLDTQADVLLIDVRGPTPFGRRALEVLMNARDRLLRPGGVIVAARDTVFVAPVRTPAVFCREVQAAHGQQNVNVEAVERVVYDTPLRCPVMAEDLLAAGQPWIGLEYSTLDRTDAAGSAQWEFDRAQSVDGLAAWFTTDLGGGYGFSTAPGGDVSAYRQMYIPFRHSVNVQAGECVRVHLSATQARDSYLWEWRVWLSGRGSTEGRMVVNQNSLAEIVIDPAALPLTAADVKPSLGPRGRALSGLFARMNGQQSLSALAETLSQQEPSLFHDLAAATEFVTVWVLHADRLERGSD